MKRFALFVTGCALAGVLMSGCSKGTSTSEPSSAVSGPITDSASNGLKATTTTTVAMGDPKHGEEIFEQNCASCHGAHAEGGMGPSLKGEKKRKNYQQTIAWIKNPQPPMSKLYPSPLNDQDVADVAAYVQSL